MPHLASRPPAVAGLFYPAEPEALRAELDACLAAAAPVPAGGAGVAPRAVVAPHAGYRYSGAVAASAFRALAADAEGIRRVVVAGPSHHVAFSGLALSPAARFLTPLGAVEVDPEAEACLADLPQVRLDELPHRREHALEVELPFLQRLLDNVLLVPLVCGDADAESVADVLERWVEDASTRLVVSTDLSHYLDYAAAAARDRRTTAKVLALDAGALEPEDACGRVPLAGLLALARRRGWRAHLLDQRSSGDTAGPRDRVVGYGAYAFA